MAHLESAFSETPADEAALVHIGNLIAEVQKGSMVTGFVCLVQAADADDRWLSAFVMPGQKAWETMGMLEYARSIEGNEATLGPADDEDD